MRSLVILASLIFFSAQNLKVDVDLVLVNATVTDNYGRYVVGLAQKDFHVWEDKIEQKVEYFSSEAGADRDHRR